MPNPKIRPTRRAFLMSGAALLALGGVGLASRLAGASTIVGKPGKITIAMFTDAGEPLGTEVVEKVVKSEQSWKAQLDDLAFYVTRQNGTERAFTGPYVKNYEAGIYRCICCETALFNANSKYDSHTGWPSFWEPIAEENIVELEDHSYGMVRTALSCARCDGHLGHLFSDGPQPTGLRYCINGVALRFIEQPAA